MLGHGKRSACLFSLETWRNGLLRGRHICDCKKEALSSHRRYTTANSLPLLFLFYFFFTLFNSSLFFFPFDRPSATWKRKIIHKKWLEKCVWRLFFHQDTRRIYFFLNFLGWHRGENENGKWTKWPVVRTIMIFRLSTACLLSQSEIMCIFFIPVLFLFLFFFSHFVLYCIPNLFLILYIYIPIFIIRLRSILWYKKKKIFINYLWHIHWHI